MEEGRASAVAFVAEEAAEEADEIASVTPAAVVELVRASARLTTRANAGPGGPQDP